MKYIILYETKSLNWKHHTNEITKRIIKNKIKKRFHLNLGKPEFKNLKYVKTEIPIYTIYTK